MFAGIDLSLLDDPEFKEDSVREVIITPLLTRLGYTPSGPNRVVRSKSLTHPFVYIGTRKLPVKIIPDYTMMNGVESLLVLDAKSPIENVLSRENVQQTYSYAIHPEIKCQTFSLCNGRQLVVFDVDKSEPSLVVSFEEFDSRWAEIEQVLSPRFLREPVLREFAPDLGSAFLRLGLAENVKIAIFGAQLNLFARVCDDVMTATSNCDFSGKPHCASFDFHPRLLPEILAGLPVPLAEQFQNALGRAPFQAAAELAIELDLEASLGPEIEVRTEKFVPLVVEKVLAARFNKTPPAKEATDIPDYIFRLRKAYVIKSPDGAP